MEGKSINSGKISTESLRKKLKKVKEDHRDLIQRNVVLNTELESAKKLLWAVLREKGRVAIHDRVMVASNDENIEIKASYNPKDRTTILEAGGPGIIIFHG